MTISLLTQAASDYRSRGEFLSAQPHLYRQARKANLLDKLFPEHREHEDVAVSTSIDEAEMSLEQIYQVIVAKDITTQGRMKTNARKATRVAQEMGWWDNEVAAFLAKRRAEKADKQIIESGLTLEDILVRVRLLNHTTERSMARGSKLAYSVAKHQGWMSDVRAQIEANAARVWQTPRALVGRDNENKPSYEEVASLAKQFTTRSAFQRKANKAYRHALEQNWLPKLCAHMDAPETIDYEEAKALALEYTTINKFANRQRRVYRLIREHGWDELLSHMPERKVDFSVSDEEAIAAMPEYKNIGDLRQRHRKLFNYISARPELKKRCFAHFKAKRVTFTMEHCRELAQGFECIQDFRRAYPGAFKKVILYKWSDEVFGSMPYKPAKRLA